MAAWQTIDSGSRLQLPSIPQPPPPVQRPVFPMYNVVMDALKSILPALDPLEIATRKAKLAAIQLQLSPQMQALQKKQVEAQSEDLDFRKAQHEYLRTHGFVTPRAGQYPSSYPDPKALSDIAGNLPVAEDGPPGTDLGTDKKIDMTKAPPAEAQPQIPDSFAPPITPQEGEKKFGPLPMPGGEVPVDQPQGSINGPVLDENGNPVDMPDNPKMTWQDAGQGLGLSPNRLASEEQQAMSPQIMLG